MCLLVPYKPLRHHTAVSNENRYRHRERLDAKRGHDAVGEWGVQRSRGAPLVLQRLLSDYMSILLIDTRSDRGHLVPPHACWAMFDRWQRRRAAWTAEPCDVSIWRREYHLDWLEIAVAAT